MLFRSDLEFFEGLGLGVVYFVECAEVEDDVFVDEVEHDVGEFLGFYLYVGAYASAVSDFSSGGGVEYVGEAVGDADCCAVGIAAGVVEGLDAAAAGDVVFGGGYFHAAVVGQGSYCLYEAFAEGAVSDDDGAVEVLEGAGDDFGG